MGVGSSKDCCQMRGKVSLRTEGKGSFMFQGLHYLTVEVSADGFLGPGLVVELSPALFLRVTSHICHHLGGSMGPVVSSECLTCP